MLTTKDAPVVIITGASGALGLAVTKAFAQANYKVVATIEPNSSQPSKVAEGVKIEVNPVNLTQEEEVQAFVEGVAARHGRIDVVIMLAGGFAMGRLVSTTLSQLDKMFKLNFETAYNVARVAFAQMSDQENGGKLFFVGARPTFDAAAGKNMIAYTLSKSLLNKLSELINAEGKKKNISSTVLVPSVIDTPANREAMPDADFDAWVKPEKIADILLFLCSDTAADMRETVIKVYGNV